MDAQVKTAEIETPARGATASPIIHKTDVAIVGGGLAGSLAAAMLGRAGIDAILVDPHTEYPPDFRCEKLDGDQVAILKKTGLGAAVLRVTTPDRETWVARNGRLVEKRPGDQQGIYYAPLVNTVRGEIPPQTRFIHGKATALSTGADRQSVTLSSGDVIDARLVVLANGLNISLRDSLGLKREIISPCHSISIGFDMELVGRPFAFPALTYYAERTSDRAALITMFPIGQVMRANLFVYRDMADPWLSRMRKEPQATLFELMPGLRKLLGEFAAVGSVKIRPVDLYTTRGHLQPGLVLVGDAFGTSCPAAGTGARKVLTDVERLCNVHIPQWLSTAGMDAGKIAAFYDDPVKRACDQLSINKAYWLKAFCTDPSVPWQLRRRAKFILHVARGWLRKIEPHMRLGGAQRGRSIPEPSGG